MRHCSMAKINATSTVLLRNAVVRARVNSGLKQEVENVLNRLGITMSEAIGLYLSQIKLNDGIPFDIKVPNKMTLKTFTETDKGKNIVKVDKVREIFEKAGV
jgi:DNA-damage-inducible protein J